MFAGRQHGASTRGVVLSRANDAMSDTACLSISRAIFSESTEVREYFAFLLTQPGEEIAW